MAYACLRHPHTTQERREWFRAVDQMGQYTPRARRNPRLLPNVWDDIVRADMIRSWKRHRKTQYHLEKKKVSSRTKHSTNYGLSMSLRDHWHLEHAQCVHMHKRCKMCRQYNIWHRHDCMMNVVYLKYQREVKDFSNKLFAS